MAGCPYAGEPPLCLGDRAIFDLPIILWWCNSSWAQSETQIGPPSQLGFFPSSTTHPNANPGITRRASAFLVLDAGQDSGLKVVGRQSAGGLLAAHAEARKRSFDN